MDLGPSSLADQDLIARFRAGDKAAFGHLYARYRAPIYGMCLQRLRDSALAEDAVQETFLRALKSFSRFDANLRLFSWLAAIADNQMTNILKRENRSVPTEDIDQMLGTSATNDVAEVVTDRIRLATALKRLPLQHRRVVGLHDIEDWSHGKIAESEDLTPVATRIVLSRAHAKLRRLLRGLLTWWTTTRYRLNRRVTAVAQRLSPPSMDCLFVQSSVVLFCGATLVLGLAAGSQDGNGSSHRLNQPAGLLAASDSIAVNVASGKSPPPSSLTLGSATTAHAAFHESIGPTRKHAVAPSSGRLKFEIDGPSGQTLWTHQTWFDCNNFGNAAAVAPTSGPVQTTC